MEARLTGVLLAAQTLNDKAIWLSLYLSLWFSFIIKKKKNDDGSDLIICKSTFQLELCQKTISHY